MPVHAPDEVPRRQNIGGIGNLTYLPANAQIDDVIGFDTGPGNMLIDRAAHWVSGGTLLCDIDGKLAAAGEVDDALIECLLSAPFLAKTPPKSAGREDFGEPFFETLRSEYSSGSTDHVQRTLVATMTAFTAGDNCGRLPTIPSVSPGRDNHRRRRREESNTAADARRSAALDSDLFARAFGYEWR